MKNQVTEKTWVPLGNTIALVGVILGCTWSLGGKFSAIETKVDAIPKLEAKVDKVVEDVSEQKGAFKELKSQMDNVQANARKTVKIVDKMQKSSQVAGSLNRGPYGTTN